MFLDMYGSALMGRVPPQNQDSYEAIGQRLYLLRKALDYTQGFIAQLAGVGQTAWSNYEAGRGRPEYDVVLRLEIATQAPQEWIYRGIMSRMPFDLAQKIELARRELERESRKKAR